MTWINCSSDSPCKLIVWVWYPKIRGNPLSGHWVYHHPKIVPHVQTHITSCLTGPDNMQEMDGNGLTSPNFIAMYRWSHVTGHGSFCFIKACQKLYQPPAVVTILRCHSSDGWVQVKKIRKRKPPFSKGKIHGFQIFDFPNKTRQNQSNDTWFPLCGNLSSSRFFGWDFPI